MNRICLRQSNPLVSSIVILPFFLIAATWPVDLGSPAAPPGTTSASRDSVDGSVSEPLPRAVTWSCTATCRLCGELGRIRDSDYAIGHDCLAM